MVRIDGSSIPAGEKVDADLVIVGAGPVGLVLADAMIGTQHRVYLVEAGDERLDERASQLADGESIGHPYFPLPEARGVAVGGSSHLWEEWLRGRELDEIDFERRDWVDGSGWPFGKEALAPHYTRAHEILGMSADYSIPSELDDLESVRLTRVRFNYSNTFDFAALARRIEASSNVCLVTKTVVTALEPDEDLGRINKVQASSSPGASFTFSSRVVVVAAGGVGTPQLLLDSNSHVEAGIGNSSGLVGKNLMEHPNARYGFLPGASRLPREEANWHGFDPLTRARGALALTRDEMERLGVLNGMILLTESPRRVGDETHRSIALIRRRITTKRPHSESAVRHASSLAGHPLRTLRDLWAEHLGQRVTRLSMTVEQAPNPSSRVVLGDKRDRLGRSIPILDWQLTGQERETMIALHDALRYVAERRRWGTVQGHFGAEHPRRVLRGEWHLLGTARMSASPSKGVTDAYGRSHDFPNLFIAGGATFPTVGYANPTLTMIALALRQLDQIEKALSAHVSLGPLW